MAAAMAAYHRGVDIAHVEAGLRSGNLQSPFPEEGNRRTIGALATYVLGLLLAETAIPLAAVLLTTTGLAFAAHRVGVRPGQSRTI